MNNPSQDQIKAIVDSARWAPTGDNAQPFTFEWDGKELLVREDLDRSRAFLNVGNVASQLALGMCLFNMDVGAKSQGWIARRKSVEEGAVAARVVFEPGPIDRSPFEKAVKLRTVDRRPYRPDPLSKEYGLELQRSVQNPWGIRLTLLSAPQQIEDMARLHGGFDSMMFAHRGIHDYFYQWMRFTDREAERTGDGMPLSTLGLGPADALGVRLLASWGIAQIVSRLGLARLAVHRAIQVYRQSAAFGVITVSNSDPLSFVRAGWLWQHLWLKLTLDGWSLQPVMGVALMGLRCLHSKGEGLTEPQKTRFILEEKKMREWVLAKEEESIPCAFRMGRPLSDVPTRAFRRPVDSILKL